MRWDDVITDGSTAHAWCEACPQFHARGTGRAEVSRVMRAGDDHAVGRDGFVPDPGRAHSVHVEIGLGRTREDM